MEDRIESIKTFLTDGNRLMKYGSTILKVLIIIIAVKLTLHFGSIIIDKFFIKQKQSRFGFNDRKADTLSELLKSIMKYLLYIIGIISILKEIGFDISTLLVGAGFGGIAVGFGAQSLIKDVLTGFFILFEDQFAVGEYVTIDNMSGFVEAVGLRITKLKDFSGDLHIIPNGQIAKVTNHSRDNSRALVEIDMGFDVNLDKALKILNGICEDIKKTNKDMIEGPSVLGISKFSGYGMTIRIIGKTRPMMQVNVEMELRKRIKEGFDREKINISYPTRVIIKQSGNN